MIQYQYMQSPAPTPAKYIASLPLERQKPVKKLRALFRKYLPKDFAEVMQYGMIGYVIPHTRYPAGYHTDTTQPLPFLHLASQKNYIAVYHMGIYAMPEIRDWFITEYTMATGKKPDMGKSCIRLKNIDAIPYDLFAELATKISAKQFIQLYESVRDNR